MNCTLCISTDADLDCRQGMTYSPGYSVYTDVPVVEDSYTTTPLETVKASYHPLDEETLHTSFEEAISERVLALRERLGRMNHKVSLGQDAGQIRRAPLKQRTILQPMALSLPGGGWRHGIMLGGMAFLFTLLGFDLMGLLVLVLH
ncbi:MAG TPA: hypothetical protein VKR06_11005 [Ktedonosporobacter sp.]|nr:hypothetical protein [Ktedonosporobacter sp.]